jgi:hypothetical protein
MRLVRGNRQQIIGIGIGAFVAGFVGVGFGCAGRRQ